ncbi:Ig-like domain-containing protein [Sodalis sp. RH21]|uniref:Ig-like domain-containing protein n=1 Tax=unclassified Sodalis (in: enterobacteria) TaxID=2636512 RepID=UPI0039B5635B
MPNQITITANPKFQEARPAGVTANITATVRNPRTHQPVAGVQVGFNSSVSQVGFSHTQVTTDRQGIAHTTITYPATPGTGGSATLPISASISGNGASVELILYSSALRPAYITNLAPGNIINDRSIAAGVQAIIYIPDSVLPGNIITLFWGAKSVQRAYNGDNFPWIIDIAEVFDDADILSNGDYLVFYSLSDNVGNTADAKPLEIKVRCSPAAVPTLLAPLVPTEHQGLVNISDTAADMNIIIPGDQPAVAVDDDYRLILVIKNPRGKTIRSTTVKEGKFGDAADIAIPVNLKELQGYDTASGQFFYEISRGEQKLVSFTTSVALAAY